MEKRKSRKTSDWKFFERKFHYQNRSTIVIHRSPVFWPPKICPGLQIRSLHISWSLETENNHCGILPEKYFGWGNSLQPKSLHFDIATIGDHCIHHLDGTALCLIVFMPWMEPVSVSGHIHHFYFWKQSKWPIDRSSLADRPHLNLLQWFAQINPVSFLVIHKISPGKLWANLTSVFSWPDEHSKWNHQALWYLLLPLDLAYFPRVNTISWFIQLLGMQWL